MTRTPVYIVALILLSWGCSESGSDASAPQAAGVGKETRPMEPAGSPVESPPPARLPKVVEEFRSKHPHLLYVRDPHQGIPATRNLGVRHASGSLVAIVADDYILSPDYARTITRFFEENPEAKFGMRLPHPKEWPMIPAAMLDGMCVVVTRLASDLRGRQLVKIG